MAAISLSTIRTRVLERANMVGSTFVSTAELNAIINGEAAELNDLVIAAMEDDFTQNTTFTITGANTYAVPGTTLKIRGLDIQNGAGWTPLEKCSLRDVRYSGNAIAYRQCGPRYHWALDTLYFDQLDASGTYRLWYIPEYVDLVADGDTIDYPQNWIEFVISGSAAKCLAKEESDPSVQLGLKQAIKVRIQAMAANKDASGPDRIQRTRGRDRYDDDEGSGYRR